jgi:Flp pilus assembly protein TadG
MSSPGKRGGGGIGRRAPRLAGDRTGAVAVLFAIMLVPIMLMVGLAVDVAFYISAQAQLNLAADVAAMHAVRAAAMASANNAPTSGSTPAYQYAGMLAGQQWFAAQAEPLGRVTLTGSGTPLPVTVTINYTAPTYTATVSYTGTMPPLFGPLAGVKTWPIAGTATAVLGQNYVDIAMMLDVSPSMLIGATTSDISALQAATPCAIVKTENGITPGDAINVYDYDYNLGIYGYGVGNIMPPYTGASGATIGNCDPAYLPGCQYPPQIIYGTNDTQYYRSVPNILTGDLVGSCNNGGGALGAAGPHTPQSPCAFACHQNSDTGDWYAMARSTTNPTTGQTVQLRLDLVQSAAQQVVKSMINSSPPPQTLLGIGIYTFSTSLTPLYPCSTLSSCTTPFGTDLNTAYADLASCGTSQTTGCFSSPVTTAAVAYTNYPNVFSQAASLFTGSAGNGTSSANAIKNLFIVTDGINDWNYLGIQFVGPMDVLVSNPCQTLKNQGYTIYVLYTPYYPIPAITYASQQNPASPTSSYPAGITLQTYNTETDPSSFPDYNSASYAASDTPVQAALRACATDHQNGFYTATNSTDINAAMQKMLASALNSAARASQ